jgi:hypothetical protein
MILMSLSYDVICEILNYGDDVKVHIYVRMLCKGLRNLLENSRKNYYINIWFSASKAPDKKLYWMGHLNVIDVDDMKFLT